MLPAETLLELVKVSMKFRGAFETCLKKNPALRKELDAYMEFLLSEQDKQRVWVAVRLRKVPESSSTCVTSTRNCVALIGEDAETFFFDKVFNESTSQKSLWASIAPRLHRCMRKQEHACLFAYGQTGSGKTFTMFGSPEIPGEEGVAFRAVNQIADLLRKTAGANEEEQPVIDFSFLEVYNEKVHDLLAQQRLCPLSYERDILSPGNKYSAPRYGSEERIVPQGLTRKRCDLSNLEEQIGKWLLEGACSRMVGRTVFNSRSSRSHAVATVHILWPQVDAKRQSSASHKPPSSYKETRLYLVDLAGSERAGQYALSSEQLQEGININKSLSTLGRVVAALARGQGEHLPHRESTLTWLLSDAMTGGSAKAFMVAAVHPSHPAETLSTLHYAQQYSTLQCELGMQIPKLQAKIRNLQKSLNKAKELFEDGCMAANLRLRGDLTLDAETLSNRMVKTRRDAKKLFASHPYLTWTEMHAGKYYSQALGVVQDIVDAPPPRADDEDPDGRRQLQPEDLGSQGTRDNVRCARIRYCGRHGYPDTFLWYPEESLEDVEPPSNLTALLKNVEACTQRLEEQQVALKEAKEKFAAQQR